MCVFLFFRKAMSFLIELLVLASLPISSMSNIRSISLLVFLKVFWNFRNTSRKRPTVRSKRSQVFYKIVILKKSAKFQRKQQCWSHFFRKSEMKRWRDSSTGIFLRILWNIKEHLFYRTSPIRWSWSLSLKKLYIVGSHEKVFEWLVENEFLSSSKNISPLYSTFFLHFLHNLFFRLMKFQHLIMEKSIQSNYQEMATKRYFLSIYCRNIYVWTLTKMREKLFLL